ncbi:MAG TPA: hypothetical protein VNA18_02380, partial [Nitrososphaeraceae archaeon]|nr:hypothetical protein [Nitrososphaeraceae archaeon]
PLIAFKILRRVHLDKNITELNYQFRWHKNMSVPVQSNPLYEFYTINIIKKRVGVLIISPKGFMLFLVSDNNLSKFL